MSDASLVTPEMQALIGAVSAPRTVMVTADVVDQAGSLHGRGDPRRVAEGDSVSGLVLLGLSRRDVALPLQAECGLSSQLTDELSFERQLRLGEILVRQTRIVAIRERFGGVFGHHLQSQEIQEFRDPAGVLVASRAFTMAHHSPSLENRNVIPELEDPGPRVQPEPFAEASRVGPVGEGDPMPQLVFRPDLVDAIRSCGLTWEFNGSFFDPARASRIGRLLVPGPLRIAFLYRAIEEWLADRGAIRRIRNTHRRPALHGRRSIVMGAVSHLHEADGRTFADIDLCLVNGLGEPSDRCSATVELA